MFYFVPNKLSINNIILVIIIIAIAELTLSNSVKNERKRVWLDVKNVNLLWRQQKTGGNWKRDALNCQAFRNRPCGSIVVNGDGFNLYSRRPKHNLEGETVYMYIVYMRRLMRKGKHFKLIQFMHISIISIRLIIIKI